MPLDNFGYVAPHIFRSAQPDAIGYDTLRQLGVSAVLKLNSDNSADEALWCQEHGIVLIEKDMSTFVNTVDEVMQIASLLNGIDSTLVHCQHGRDRTGLIVGAFRIVLQGWDVAKADAERKAYGVEGIIAVADFDMDVVLWEIYKRCHP